MTQPMHAPASPRTEAGGGWLTFAAVMLLLAATFNAVYGIAALANDDYFAVDELLFGDLSLWGAFYLGFAALYAITGFLVLMHTGTGILLAVAIAVVHGFAALLSIGAHPLWSATVVVMDGLIIYGLTVHGMEDFLTAGR
jgi:hypothetical protein